MSGPRRPRSAQEVADIQAAIQHLADNPQILRCRNSRRELPALGFVIRDSRRPTDPTSRRRFAADYSSPWQDQDNNYASGLL